jgi:hypothetical protein
MVKRAPPYVFVGPAALLVWHARLLALAGRRRAGARSVGFESPPHGTTEALARFLRILRNVYAGTMPSPFDAARVADVEDRCNSAILSPQLERQ